mgnify:CR=1 FL=1
MKKLITVLIAATTLMSALAQPINYQGRLSDKSGTNVNGTKNFALRIFDAKTGGKQIYEENVGAVTVNEGAYSFNFGKTASRYPRPLKALGLRMARSRSLITPSRTRLCWARSRSVVADIPGRRPVRRMPPSSRQR